MSEYDDPGLPRRHRLMRRFAILFVSIVGTLALVYDYTVARPSVDQAYNRINARLDEADVSLPESLSNAEVRELLQKQPSRIFQDGGKHVEVFSWIAGFPLRTHDLYVVYDERGQTSSLIRHFKFVYRSDRHYHSERSVFASNRDGSSNLTAAESVTSDTPEAATNASDLTDPGDGDAEDPVVDDPAAKAAGKLPAGRSAVTEDAIEDP